VKAIPTETVEKIQQMHSDGNSIHEIMNKLNMPVWMVSQSLGHNRSRKQYEDLQRGEEEKSGYFDVNSQNNWLVTE
jgi:hypothetical protein